MNLTQAELMILGGDRLPYRNPKMQGRLDVNGVEWWACDPYPTWYRWVDGRLSDDFPARWAK